MSILIYVWPLTGGLAAGWALLERRAWLRGARLRELALQVLPAIIPVVMLGFGALFACQDCSPSSLGQGLRHDWAGHVVGGLLVGQIVAAGLLVRRATGRRWSSAVLQSLLFWFSLSASFVATMSISGDWI